MTKPFVTFAESRQINPKKTEEIADAGGAWTVTVFEPDGNTRVLPRGSDVCLDGFSGSARIVVVLDPDTGQPVYDKLLYSQKPGVAIVAFDRDARDAVRFLWLSQERPFADDPDSRESAGSLVFGQIPMGFFTPKPNQDVDDAITDAVRRELKEEAGVTRVISIEIPTPKVYWADPTCFTNGTYVAFAEVEFTAVGGPERGHDDGERIRRAEHLTVRELLSCIRQGRTPDGVIHHMGLSLGPLMMFFARHPELFVEAP
jgi:8-oxo-dGTP pyrophosphatase MutT (NUDIX family)